MPSDAICPAALGGLGCFDYMGCSVYGGNSICLGGLGCAENSSRFGSLGYSGNFTCSGCSVFYALTFLENIMTMFGVIVEKLWERLRESLWGNGGKNSGKVERGQKVVEKARISTCKIARVEKFSGSFPRALFPVSAGICTFST